MNKWSSDGLPAGWFWIGVWRPWFAWYPVLVDHCWTWLDTVERRACYPKSSGAAASEWRYRSSH